MGRTEEIMTHFTLKGMQRLIDTTPLEELMKHELGADAFHSGHYYCVGCGKFTLAMAEEGDNRAECHQCGLYCDPLTYLMIRHCFSFTEAIERLELIHRSLGIDEGNPYEVYDDYEGEEPLRECIDDGMVYCSMPPKCRCKRCHQYWITGEKIPVCLDQETRDIQPSEVFDESTRRVFMEAATKPLVEGETPPARRKKDD